VTEAEDRWETWLRRACYGCDPCDDTAPHGFAAIRGLCAGFLKAFPPLGDASEDQAVGSVRWLCQTILDELAWEEQRWQVRL
jgi:hypothetical protein